MARPTPVHRITPVDMAGNGAPTLRIDKFLWFVRLANSRSSAQKMAEQGVIRLNGRRIDRAHAPVRPGDLITFPYGESARVVRVTALPVRRGPSAEAAEMFEEIVVGG